MYHSFPHAVVYLFSVVAHIQCTICAFIIILNTASRNAHFSHLSVFSFLICSFPHSAVSSLAFSPSLPRLPCLTSSLFSPCLHFCQFAQINALQPIMYRHFTHIQQTLAFLDLLYPTCITLLSSYLSMHSCFHAIRSIFSSASIRFPFLLLFENTFCDPLLYFVFFFSVLPPIVSISHFFQRPTSPCTEQDVLHASHETVLSSVSPQCTSVFSSDSYKRLYAWIPTRQNTHPCFVLMKT